MHCTNSMDQIFPRYPMCQGVKSASMKNQRRLEKGRSGDCYISRFAKNEPTVPFRRLRYMNIPAESTFVKDVCILQNSPGE